MILKEIEVKFDVIDLYGQLTYIRCGRLCETQRTQTTRARQSEQRPDALDGTVSACRSFLSVAPMTDSCEKQPLLPPKTCDTPGVGEAPNPNGRRSRDANGSRVQTGPGNNRGLKERGMRDNAGVNIARAFVHQAQFFAAIDQASSLLPGRCRRWNPPRPTPESYEADFEDHRSASSAP